MRLRDERDLTLKRLALALLFLCLTTIIASAANRFAVCTTTCTWDGASTAMWSTASGGATGASVPTSGDAVIFDGSTCVGGTTCTTTVNTNPTIASLSMGNCTASTTGCIIDFSVNNNNISLGSFSGTGATGVRTLRMGNGTWTITATTGTVVWDFNNINNLTFNANGSTLLFQATTNNNRTMNTGGLTYSTVAVGANPNGIFSFNGSLTAATFNITGQNAVLLSVAGNTITNPLTWTGTSGNEIYVFSSTAGAQAEIVGNGGAMTWIAPRDIKFTTGTYTATNSFNLGHNTNVTITPPGAGGGACILG